MPIDNANIQRDTLRAHNRTVLVPADALNTLEGTKAITPA